MSVKISELTELESVNDNDVIPIVDIANEGTKKIKFKNIRNAINGEIIFENEAGLNDNITTTKNITSFKNIKIDYFMTIGDYTLKDSKIIQINTGESFQLSFVITHSTQLMIFDSARYLVNNATTIKKQVELDTRIGSANDVTFNEEVSRIKITKITGYLD